MIAQVLLSLPIDTAFDFLVPETLLSSIAVGKRVRVRFRAAERGGIVLSLSEKTEHVGELERVLDVSKGPAFSPEALFFSVCVAERYLAPLGVAVNRMLPRRASEERGRVFAVAQSLGEVSARLESLSRRAPRQAAVLRFFLTVPGPASEREVRTALGSVRAPLEGLVRAGLVREVVPSPVCPDEGATVPRDRETCWADRLSRSSRVLLMGKDRWDTYAELVREALASGRRALVLSPEILLARQLATHLRGRVKSEVELYHSASSESERGGVWERARRGEARVVVGTRSALFLPLPSLGLVIVDEEQDRSYKQEEMVPRYHARSVAFDRVREGLVLYGSEAPSLESFHAAEAGKLELARLASSRPGQAIRVVDLRKERAPLSEPLESAMEAVLAAGRQVILGVNLAGYFQAVLCKDCGRPLRCPTCGVSLSYRPGRGQLSCHLCGKAYPGLLCGECGSRSLRFVGMGSERVEEVARERFPKARVARIDLETLRTSGEERAVEQLLRGEFDILVATPMIAKGQALPRVGLVAAVGIDALLALPDFRAAEWTYQYLVGLAGRVADGEAMVETHYPEHYAIQAAARGDYEGFYRRECAERRALSYPPFSHLARLVLLAKSDPTGKRISAALAGFDVEVLGPSPLASRAGHAKVLLKGRDEETVRAACLAVRKELAKVEVDLDPARL